MVATNRKETFPQKAERAALARWKLETLTGLHGLESLERQTKMSRANQEAENKWARKQLWGEEQSSEEPSDNESEGDNMRGHILGDVTYPAPIVVNNPPQNKSQLLPALALAAATMIPTTGAAAGIIGYLLAQPKQPAAQVQEAKPYEYESFSLGLGRLEDFDKDK